MSKRDRLSEFFPPREDPDNAERMITEIALGVPKEQARSVYDAETSALWDRMEPGIKDAMARGLIIETVVPGDNAVAPPDPLPDPLNQPRE